MLLIPLHLRKWHGMPFAIVWRLECLTRLKKNRKFAYNVKVFLYFGYSMTLFSIVYC